MFEYFEGRDGGGCFGDLYKRKNQRHLEDHVHECLRAEAPFAELSRNEELTHKAARRAYTAANNAHTATLSTYNKTFVRIEGGHPVTYFGDEADKCLAQRTLQHVPRPPAAKVVPPSHVEDEGLLIARAGSADQVQRPSGKRRLPSAPNYQRVITSGDRQQKGELSLLGSGGPRTIHKMYHDQDPGFGGEPRRDIIFNDRCATSIPSKSERIRIAKATIPNPIEEEAAARATRTQGASARLPTVWKRSNYPYAWMMKEAKKDDIIYKSIWRQRKERGQRRQHEEVNLNVDYKRLKGAALSVNSPRFLQEEANRIAEAQAAERRAYHEREWAQKLERDQRLAASQPSGGASAEGKHLSSTMRRELGETFKRLKL